MKRLWINSEFFILKVFVYTFFIVTISLGYLEDSFNEEISNYLEDDFGDEGFANIDVILTASIENENVKPAPDIWTWSLHPKGGYLPHVRKRQRLYLRKAESEKILK